MAKPKNPVLSEILRQGRGRPKKHVKAAIETGIVESGLRNLPGGDADSAGWRQERASLYRDPTNLKASVRRFYTEAAQHDRGGIDSGELAARVQRPAAQYRGRYKQQSGRAEQIFRGGGSGGGTPVAGGGGQTSQTVQFKPWQLQTGTETSFDRPGFEQAQKRTLLAQILSRRRPNSVLFKSGLLSTTAPSEQDFTTTQRTSRIVPGSVRVSTQTTPGGGSLDLAAGGQGQASRVIREASKRMGVGEVGSSNRGQRLDKWQARYGMVGQPWCGIFTGISLQQAGVKGVTPRIASVAATIQDARAGKNGFRAFLSARHARQGDVFTIGSGTHMGLVAKNNGDGTVTTIEGNTGNGKVERKRRRIAELSGVARPRYR